DKVTLLAQGQRCQGGAGTLEATPTAESVTLVVNFRCAATVRELVVRDDLFDVLGTDYHTLARITAGEQADHFAFTPDSRETRMSLSVAAGAGAGLLSFVRLGVEHILSGWDHLLFLFGLILPGGGVLALLKIVTAFTLAHSLTLSLAALDIV